jgi:hypothetical protein
LALIAATTGYLAWTGTLWPPLAEQMAGFAGLPDTMGAIITLLVGLVAVAFVAALSAILLTRGVRARR